jgi:hypothetical protein
VNLFSAVDRSHQSSLSDARDAFINVAIDVLSAYKLLHASGGQNGLLTPYNLRLLPLYILALLKYVSMIVFISLKQGNHSCSSTVGYEGMGGCIYSWINIVVPQGSK